MRVASPWMGSMPQKRPQRNPSTISPMRTARRWSFMNQEESPHQTLKLPGPWSWTSQPPEMWDIIICCLGCPVCSNLLQWHDQTNTPIQEGNISYFWFDISFFLTWQQLHTPIQRILEQVDASTSFPEHPHAVLV